MSAPAGRGIGGKGGKSLELMQQRLLSQQKAENQQQAPAPTPSPAPAPAAQPAPAPATGRPGKSAAQLMASSQAQARDAAQAQAARAATAPVAATPAANPPAPSPAVVGRPKGKNFAAMQMSAAASKPPAPAPAPPPAPAPAPVAAPAPVVGKPKGKDFSAMANRMGAPVMPAPAAPRSQPTYSQAQKTRAAQMQAAARAAAGLPPLDRPTATSVTTTPPPITPTKPVARQPSASYAPPPTDTRPQQHMDIAARAAKKITLSRQPSVGRRGSTGKSSVPSPLARSAPAPSSLPPTPQPTAAEARLSSPLSISSGAPYMAPLVGQRIQDLVKSIDPNYSIDADAEEQVLKLADDFLDKVTRQGLRLAQHRGSKTLDVQDLQVVLSKQWGIVVPGLGLPNFLPTKPGARPVSKATGAKRKASDASLSAGGGPSKKSGPAVTMPATT